MSSFRYPKGSFAEVIAICQREAANENLGIEDTVDAVITDLTLAGFAIKRSHDVVNYDLDVMVLHSPAKGTAGTFAAQPQIMAASVDDLGGVKGWLVVWNEQGRARAAWFDPEGVSKKLPDYRVINPKTPCAGALAAQGATPTQQVA